MSTGTFTDAVFAYLDSQRVARLATVAPDGAPQNNPVGFRHNPELGTIDIYGLNMGATRRYRNERVNPHVALVVDDLASVDPWRVRGMEIRGWAEALDAQAPARADISGDVVRLFPWPIISWGVDPDQPGIAALVVAGTGAGASAGAAGTAEKRVT